MDVEGKTLLLVEDEVLIAMAARKLLENSGYRVLHASSGEEACKIALAHIGATPMPKGSGDLDPVDLVLMDIDLGRGMDGTSAAREILAARDIPIVFLSSHIEKTMVERTQEISGYGYVVKNSGIAVLDASIKMAFKLFEAQRGLGRKNRELEAANEELRVTVEELQAARAKLEEANAGLIEAEAKVRKQSEKLQESKERLSRAEAIAKIGNWELHLETGNITASAGAELIYGLRGEEWALSVVQKVPLPEFRPDMDAALRGLIERGEPYDIDFKIRQVDTGNIIDIHSVALYNPARKTLFGVIQDLTERTRMENELRMKSLLLDSVNDRILALDYEGNLVYVNDALCRGTGYDRNELLGKSVALVMGREDTPSLVARIASIEERGFLEFASTRVHKNGETFPVRVFARSLDAGGRKLIVAMDRDSAIA